MKNYESFDGMRLIDALVWLISYCPDRDHPAFIKVRQMQAEMVAEDVEEREVLAYFAGTDGPFKCYRNPMRDDGVFVGQDRPNEPYGYGPGEQHYPAVPQSAKAFPQQLPRETAAAIVEKLNQAWRESRKAAPEEAQPDITIPRYKQDAAKTAFQSLCHALYSLPEPGQEAAMKRDARHRAIRDLAERIVGEPCDFEELC